MYEITLWGLKNGNMRRIFEKFLLKENSLSLSLSLNIYIDREMDFFFCSGRNFEYIYIYSTFPQEQDVTQGQFLKRSLTRLNSEFSFS